jgi:hypothetical protein
MASICRQFSGVYPLSGAPSGAQLYNILLGGSSLQGETHKLTIVAKNYSTVIDKLVILIMRIILTVFL